MKTWRLIVTVQDTQARTEVETDGEAPTIGEVLQVVEAARAWVTAMRVPVNKPKNDMADIP